MSLSNPNHSRMPRARFMRAPPFVVDNRQIIQGKGMTVSVARA